MTNKMRAIADRVLFELAVQSMLIGIGVGGRVAVMLARVAKRVRG